MIYGIARCLQLVGLVLLPVALAGQAIERLTVGQMLSVAGLGIVIFYTGVQLQKGTKGR